MPHKSNPVLAEALVTLARFSAGLVGALLQAMPAEYERSGAAWTLEWLTLPPLVAATATGLRHASTMCRGLRFAAARIDESPRPGTPDRTSALNTLPLRASGEGV